MSAAATPAIDLPNVTTSSTRATPPSSTRPDAARPNTATDGRSTGSISTFVRNLYFANHSASSAPEAGSASIQTSSSEGLASLDPADGLASLDPGPGTPARKWATTRPFGSRKHDSAQRPGSTSST